VRADTELPSDGGLNEIFYLGLARSSPTQTFNRVAPIETGSVVNVKGFNFLGSKFI